MKIVNFQRHPLVTFFILTFVWSWGCWSHLVATTPPDGMQAGISPVYFFPAILGGGIGPSLAGLLITRIVEG